tara:strand:- start:116 stop:334 length:219 start_codon:yes stop_codon:yes gene_type:complete
MIDTFIFKLTGKRRYQVIHIEPGRELRTWKSHGRCTDNRKFANVRAFSAEDARNKVPFGTEILKVIPLGMEG